MQDIDDFVESLRKPKKVKNADKEKPAKTTKSSTKKVKRKAKVKQEKTENLPVLHRKDGTPVSNTEFKNILDESVESVYHLLEINDTDSATQLLYKRVIQSAYKMLAKIESSMEESPGTRGAYPFNAVATTLRDYITDLQASMDRGRLAEGIIDNILRPMFLEIASSVVLEISTIEKEAKLKMSESDFSDFHTNVARQCQQRIIDVMQRAYTKAKEDTNKAMQR
jgi:hypothetical protein